MRGRGKGKRGEGKGERMWRGPESGLPRGPCWLLAACEWLNILKLLKFIMFADDTNIFISNKNLDFITHIIKF